MPPSCPHLFVWLVLRQILEKPLHSLSLDVGLEALLRAHTPCFVPGHHLLALDTPSLAELPGGAVSMGGVCVLECWPGGLREERCREQARMCQAALHYLPAWKPRVNHGAQLRAARAGVRGDAGLSCGREQAQVTGQEVDGPGRLLLVQSQNQTKPNQKTELKQSNTGIGD